MASVIALPYCQHSFSLLPAERSGRSLLLCFVAPGRSSLRRPADLLQPLIHRVAFFLTQRRCYLFQINLVSRKDLFNKCLPAIRQIHIPQAPVRGAVSSRNQPASLQPVNRRRHRRAGQQNLLPNGRDRQRTFVQQNLQHHKVADSKPLSLHGILDVIHDRSMRPRQNQPEPGCRDFLGFNRHLAPPNSYDIRYLDIEIRFRIWQQYENTRFVRPLFTLLPTKPSFRRKRSVEKSASLPWGLTTVSQPDSAAPTSAQPLSSVPSCRFPRRSATHWKARPPIRRFAATIPGRSAPRSAPVPGPPAQRSKPVFPQAGT